MRVLWRMYAGPAYVQNTSPYFFDWSALPTDLNVRSTLQESCTPESLVISLTDATLFPEAGGVWIRQGKHTDYIQYASRENNTLTGLSQTPSRTYTAGAAVLFFWEVETVFGNLQLEYNTDSAKATTDWVIKVGGAYFPANCLKNLHLAIIQTSPDGISWSHEYVGWINSPKVVDASDRVRPWTLTVMSLKGILALTRLRSITVGARDVAPKCQISTDTVCVKPFHQRKQTGDFTQAEPVFSGQSVVDGSLDTLFVAERYKGIDQRWSPYRDYSGPITLNLTQEPGQTVGYRYIEFRARRPGVADPDDPEAVASQYPLKKWRLYDNKGNYETVDLEGQTVPAEAPFFFVVEDQTLFRSKHPLAEGLIYELPKTSTWFDNLDLEHGACALWYNGWTSCAAWGDGSVVTAGAGDNWPNNSPAFEWAVPPSPLPGQIIRYKSTVGGWVTDYVDLVGYSTVGAPDPWILFTLPSLSLSLRDTLSSSYPAEGDWVYIVDPTGACTLGLAPSGVIQIGEEQFTYSEKTDAAIKIVARTDPQAHAQGDPIYQVDPTTLTKSKGVWLTQLEWYRKPDSIHTLESFRWYWSNEVESPDNPNTPHWDAHWTELTPSIHSYHDRSWIYPLNPPILASHVMLNLDHMEGATTDDPSRPRVNEVRLLLWEVPYVDPGMVVIEPGASTTTVIHSIFQQCGIPASAISIANELFGLDRMTTQDTNAWAVLADFADYAGLCIDVLPNSTINVRENPYRQVGTLTPQAVWEPSQVVQFEAIHTGGQQVAQVSVTWVSADRLSEGVVFYPNEPDGFGPIEQVQAKIFFDDASATAYAAKTYYTKRFPYTYVLNVPSTHDDLYALRMLVPHQVTLTLGEQTAPTTILGMCVAVTAVVSEGRLSLTYTLLEMESSNG